MVGYIGALSVINASFGNPDNEDSRNDSTVFLSKSSFSISSSFIGKLFMASINANLTSCSPFWCGYCSS